MAADRNLEFSKKTYLDFSRSCVAPFSTYAPNVVKICRSAVEICPQNEIHKNSLLQNSSEIGQSAPSYGNFSLPFYPFWGSLCSNVSQSWGTQSHPVSTMKYAYHRPLAGSSEKVLRFEMAALLTRVVSKFGRKVGTFLPPPVKMGEKWWNLYGCFSEVKPGAKTTGVHPADLDP